MRKQIRHLFTDLIDELKQNHVLNEEQSILVITVELVLTVFKELEQEGSAYEAWSMLPGYNHPILPNTDLTHVQRLRILCSNIRNRHGWVQMLEEYGDIDQSYRCYLIDEDGHYEYKEPVFVTHRIQRYRDTLGRPIEHAKQSLTFITSGDFYYQRREEDEILTFQGEIPEHLIQEKDRLPLYREKKRFPFNVKEEQLKAVGEMDRLTESKRWSKTFQGMKLKRMGKMPPESTYDQNIHIVGGLGTGKSTFTMIEIFRLVKYHHAKIGIIEGSVEQVLERVKELKNLGIKAVPIIGKSSREQHLSHYIYSHAKEIIDITDWGTDPYEELKYLSGKCIIQALADDETGSSRYPCRALERGKEKYICPLYTSCGVYRAELELINADVWVATSASVLKSRISPMIDPYNRTYYEAMYDLLDIIFVDEADKVQQEFDDAFISEYDLFGEENYLYEQLFILSSNKIMRDYTTLSNGLVSNWSMHLNHLKSVVEKIYHLLSYSSSLRNKFLSHEIFHIYRLLHEIAKELFGDEYDESRGFQTLKEYIDSPFEKKGIALIVDELLTPGSGGKSKELLGECMSQLQLDKPINNQLIEQKLEFFLYLVRLDHLLRYLIHNFPNVSAVLNIENEVERIFRTTPRDYLPFIKDSMTGMLLGYRYIGKEGDKLGTFKIIEYNGVGRQLLTDWHSIYELADEKKGPAIVFLSGTSYAPGSHHFHLDIPVHWVLTADRPKPKIEQFFRPVFNHAETSEPIFISGIRNKDERGQALIKMIHQLKQDFSNEIDYWKDEKRKILLVVNSYEDLRSVKVAFSHDFLWENKVKILTRDLETNEMQYSKRQIEDFVETNADLLAVPLMAVGRGYNILDLEKERSLFGSVFFLIRPYTVPGDIHNMIQILHAYLPHYLNEIKDKCLRFEKGISKLRQKSRSQLEEMVRRPDYWKILNDKEREILSWYLFILMWQMIGRLLRGGSAARVFYVDAKFAFKSAVGEKDTIRTSLLKSWKEMMSREDDFIFNELYGPFINSIKHLEV